MIVCALIWIRGFLLSSLTTAHAIRPGISFLLTRFSCHHCFRSQRFHKSFEVSFSALRSAMTILDHRSYTPKSSADDRALRASKYHWVAALAPEPLALSRLHFTPIGAHRHGPTSNCFPSASTRVTQHYGFVRTEPNDLARPQCPMMVVKLPRN